MHLPALANLSSQWLPTIIARYSTNLSKIYSILSRKINGNKSQSRDKMLQILQRFVLYPTMMVANHYNIARQIGQCLQVHVFHLVSLSFIAVIDPYSPFKFIIFKLFLYVYFLWFSYSYSQLVSENICSTELYCYSVGRNYLLI